MDLTEALRLDLHTGAPEVVALVGGGGKSSTLFRLAAEAAARGRRAIATTTTQLGAAEVLAAPAVVEAGSGALPLEALTRALEAHGWCLAVGPVQGEKRSGLTPAQVDELAAQAERLDLALIAVEADGSRKLPLKAPAAHEPVIPDSATLVIPVAGVDAVGRMVVAGQVHRPEQVQTALGLEAGARLAPAQIARLMLHPEGGDKNRPPRARRVALLNKVERPDQAAQARLVAAQWVAAGAAGIIAAVGSERQAPVLERWAPLAVVVLAAGQASRMGRPKQLLPVEGVSMVRRAVQTALASGAQQVALVTGAYAAEITDEVANAATAADGPRLTLVHNPAWATGQASSMQAGLAALDPSVEAVIFLPVDQPFLPSALLRRMARLWQKGAAMVAPQVEGELRGAPALFDRTLWPELQKVEGDVGGRAVLRGHAEAVQTLAVDPAWLRDLDRPEDLSF